MTDPFAQTLAAWPPAASTKFGVARGLILSAAHHANAGQICESLKWGQPAWRPTRPRQATTLRANWSDKSPQTLTLFVDCRTRLAATMRDIYPHDFVYESSRALNLSLDADLPAQAIDHLARLTFTYHRTR
ncbi:hypothetical protein [uncultured Sulfitobacter sp.]|uniref:hypothetical protein n=1 Tax=uncultured Sulfitobacter sp. TaxID=191468 RepID=UPI00260D966B|nr:hypothetical protein [uncultured Sulfitobacter sp.]